MSHEILKKGYLYKLPVKGFKKKWTNKWFVLYATSREGVVRVEYYDNEECSTSGIGKRTILLRDCIGISSLMGSKVHPYVFQFRTLLGHHVLAAESQLEMKDWIDYIKEVVLDDKNKRRRSKSQSRVMTSSISNVPDTLSGQSYRNKVDSGTYRITIEENETSAKVNLSGTYNLELYPSKFTLTASSGAAIFTLYYKSLKNYGKRSGQFHFEVGKNSPIIEGELVFVTTCSQEIFGVVHNNIMRLKEQAQHGNATEHAAEKPSESQVKVKPPVPPPMPLRPPSLRSRASRHSTEIHDESVPCTYRYSKDMEDLHATQPIQEAQIDVRLEVPTIPYSVADKSNKTSMEKKNSPTPPRPSTGGEVRSPTETERATYNDPYVSDHLACRGPFVPSHHNSVQDSSISSILVKRDYCYGDGKNQDHSHQNLEPLAGVSNPLNAVGSEGVTGTTKYFGIHPCNFGPINVPDTSGNSTDLASFNFDCGQMSVGQQFCPGTNDPFSTMNIAVSSQVPPADNIAEFDFGSLDANFIAKLDALEVKDKQVALDAGSRATTLSTYELDYFWENIDSSLQ